MTRTGASPAAEGGTDRKRHLHSADQVLSMGPKCKLRLVLTLTLTLRVIIRRWRAAASVVLLGARRATGSGYAEIRLGGGCWRVPLHVNAQTLCVSSSSSNARKAVVICA